MRQELINHIEALLFLSGKPLNLRELSKILNKKEKEINKSLVELESVLEESGIRILKKGDNFMLGTSPESSKYCEMLVKEELNRNLGHAGLETLAIILYKNPKEGVGRADIDYIRGVNSTFTLRSLLIKGLIERKINPKDRRSFIYKPSLRIFQYLGVTKKEDLPEFEKFSEQLKSFEE